MSHLLHRLALAALAVVATQSFLGVVRHPIGSAFEQALHPILAVALWSFLFWKLLRKPRRWSLGLGILFLVMIAFQTHFWIRAIHDPEVTARGFDTGIGGFVLSELPIAIAAILCLALRWHMPAPADPKGPSEVASPKPATRDPNKLEPAYLVTLAVIIGLPVCCSYFSRETAAAPKMSIPERGIWTVTGDDNKSGRGGVMNVAVENRKWRVETRNPENGNVVVVVNDGQRISANEPSLEQNQLERFDPLKLMRSVAITFNKHPKPDPVSLDGVLCWHVKARHGANEVEAWLDSKNGILRKFIMKEGDGHVMNVDFENFSETIPNDPRIFDGKALEPVLTH